MTVPQRVMIGDERAVLENALDHARVSLTATVSDLSEAEARRRLVASSTTPIGLIKHAAVVERYWFQHFWAGWDDSRCDGSVTAGDMSFVVESQETIADVTAEFVRAVRRSRIVTADADLGSARHHPRYGPIQLRFVYLRLIAEYSRHAGHADILREQIEALRAEPN
ncbi:DinB family protein [Mycobacterium sp. Aquia_216]|uniref:DinB family protein n=1 Tax=Mycobacterium sp. Aquia_216 TaxID=2991729 RepID=UPI00227C8236|nr:DinB family protein [Mycobacterium sp. Aquia_216]WAJ44303.1 DinB family protein [Mycobacterium sp. Aquia_216]